MKRTHFPRQGEVGAERRMGGRASGPKDWEGGAWRRMGGRA
jgi:hypothetical protein